MFAAGGRAGPGAIRPRARGIRAEERGRFVWGRVFFSRPLARPGLTARGTTAFGRPSHQRAVTIRSADWTLRIFCRLASRRRLWRIVFGSLRLASTRCGGPCSGFSSPFGVQSWPSLLGGGIVLDFLLRLGRRMWANSQAPVTFRLGHAGACFLAEFPGSRTSDDGDDPAGLRTDPGPDRVCTGTGPYVAGVLRRCTNISARQGLGVEGNPVKWYEAASSLMIGVRGSWGVGGRRGSSCV